MALLEEQLLLAPSPIHGMGCFATRAIPEDAVIMEYAGELIDLDTAVRRNDPTQPDHSEYILELSEEWYLDGRDSQHISRYVNHSCEPNCYLQIEGMKAFILARRDIAVGEELLYDYLFDEDVREPCRCGALTCRGYI
jgi:uncharacterized protein